ncbi:MAG: hypothetical protein CMH55_01410 [Myxococcales bacterium]|nr:hypothetical protein [Myxococcales bacterium]
MSIRLLILGLFISGCPSAGPNPETIAQQFLTHLSRSEGAQAHGLLCKRDQAMLAALSSRLGSDPIKSLSALQLRAGATFQVQPGKVTADSAEVHVLATGDMSFSLHLSPQASSWCLHLPHLDP